MRPIPRASKLASFVSIAVVVLLLVVAGLVIWAPKKPSVSQPTVPPQWRPTPYTERAVRLPGFDPLFGYVNGGNCHPDTFGGGCFIGGTNYSQVPVLSSDSGQPLGIYYVNNASELVEYQLPGGSVRAIANVTLLYQTYTNYSGMLANEFFLPYGYDEALFFGTIAPTSPAVSIETVNLTTGTVTLVTTSIPIAPDNQQPILISNNLVAVVSSRSDACVDCPGGITVVNVATDASWSAADLPFFEANNIYWLPQKSQLINVEAHGATADEVEQWNESTAPNVTFRLATTVGADDQYVPVNWVNGIGYNASTDRIAYSAGGLGEAFTYVLAYGPDGLLTTNNETRYVDSMNGTTTSGRLFNGQQYVYTSDWVTGGFYDRIQYLLDPWNGTIVPTNEPFTNLSGFIVCDASCFLGTYGPSLEYHIDFSASVARNDPFWSVVLATA